MLTAITRFVQRAKNHWAEGWEECCKAVSQLEVFPGREVFSERSGPQGKRGCHSHSGTEWEREDQKPDHSVILEKTQKGFVEIRSRRQSTVGLYSEGDVGTYGTGEAWRRVAVQRNTEASSSLTGYPDCSFAEMKSVGHLVWLVWHPSS